MALIVLDDDLVDFSRVYFGLKFQLGSIFLANGDFTLIVLCESNQLRATTVLIERHLLNEDLLAE